MSDAIGDLLSKRKYDEPPEVKIIKDFVLENYNHAVGVTVKPTNIVIHVKSAALAGALRMKLHLLKESLNTEKQLIIRID